MLRRFLTSERSGVVKTFRYATYAELNANPYESPESIEPAHESVVQRTPARATIAACMAPIALAGFVIHDPWQTRDGVWLMTLAEALPWFLASVFLPVYALMVRDRSRFATWIAAGSLLILAVLPQTWGLCSSAFHSTDTDILVHRSHNMVFTQVRGFALGAWFGLQIRSLRCRLLVCHAADTASLATWLLFGKLFGVAMLVGFGEKRCRKNLPLCDLPYHDA